MAFTDPVPLLFTGVTYFVPANNDGSNPFDTFEATWSAGGSDLSYAQTGSRPGSDNTNLKVQFAVDFSAALADVPAGATITEYRLVIPLHHFHGSVGDSPYFIGGFAFYLPPPNGALQGGVDFTAYSIGTTGEYTFDDDVVIDVTSLMTAGVTAITGAIVVGGSYQT
jgi:hypothetical protein